MLSLSPKTHPSTPSDPMEVAEVGHSVGAEVVEEVEAKDVAE